MEIEIIPAIIPKSFEHLKSQLALVKGIVHLVQIDITDGIFAPTKTWPFVEEDINFEKIKNQKEGMPFWEDLNFEFDLMIKNPEKTIDDWINVGASALIIHIESTNEIENLIEKIKDRNILIGVSLNPNTENEKVYQLVDKINFVQFMGNDKIGYHEVELDEKVYKKINDFRNKYPKVPISIDIGVNKETIPHLVKSGANRLISGSSVFNSDDIKKTIEKLKELSLR